MSTPIRMTEMTPEATIEEAAPAPRAWDQLRVLVTEHPLVMVVFLLGCIPTFSACAIFFDTLPRAVVVGIAIGVQAALTLIGAPVWMLRSEYDLRTDFFSWTAALLDVFVNAGAIYYVAGVKLAQVDTIRAGLEAMHQHVVPFWMELVASCILAAFLAFAPVKLYYRSV